ncbi:response regulator [Thalassotalea maritima]|uniref:response regulator n=1 Tax=Thalassotalea maritima TaxID=3242416 RepID=UPI003529A1A1
MHKQLLIIDDDIELVELLSDFLANEGYQVACAYDGEQGLAKIRSGKFDLILLDVMMPKLNGFDVLKALGGKYQTPILMLTAKDSDSDRVLGLELGADDYLSKPYNPSELLARIRAILRRIDILQNKDSDMTMELNDVRVNGHTREVFCHQQLLLLTGTEYEMLRLLMTCPDQIVSKEILSNNVLGRPLSAYDRSIDMHISNIRRKLHQFCNDDKIKTVRGVGYVFMSGTV